MNIQARLTAFHAYLVARRDLLQAARRYAVARDEHGLSKAWGNRIVEAHRALVNARRVMRTGRA